MNPLTLPDNLDQVISGRVIDDIINIFFRLREHARTLPQLSLGQALIHTGLPPHALPSSTNIHRKLDSQARQDGSGVLRTGAHRHCLYFGSSATEPGQFGEIRG